MSPESKVSAQKFAILVTGEHGGTGSSTTAKQLEKKLDIERVSGGKLLRALSWKFQEYLSLQGPSLSVSEVYYNFHALCQDIYSDLGYAGLAVYVQNALDMPHDEEILRQFHDAIQYNPISGTSPATLWDCFVDTQIFGEVLDASGGVVLESKLAIALPDIDQIKALCAEHPAFAMPMLRVLLTVDIAEAARRISSRENEVSPQAVVGRRDRDFHRYRKMYDIAGKPLTPRVMTSVITPERVATHQALKIDTTEIDAETVTYLIIAKARKLLGIAQEPALAAAYLSQD